MNELRENHQSKLKIPLYFLITRLVFFLSLPLEGIRSYGDFWNFYQIAELGRPYLDIWVEFPPIFPIISRWIYLLTGGREHAFIYLQAFLFSVIQATTIYLFQIIADRIWDEKGATQRTIVYALLTVGLFYGWAYFDIMAVFSLLLGLVLVMKSKRITAGVVFGLGGLVKWFPILALPAVWKWKGRRKAVRIVVVAISILVLVWGSLYIISPTFTRASLISQGAKGSWETVWALLDGNLSTGNFNPLADRQDPATASIPTGNPPKVSPWITLIILGSLGFFLFLKAKIENESQLVAFTGLTLIFFFLWSPGYSPQWVLYLIPLVLVSFKENRHLLLGLVILLINLLEWPLLLSRGLFQFLPAVILLRTGIYCLAAVMFAEIVLRRQKSLSES